MYQIWPKGTEILFQTDGQMELYPSVFVRGYQYGPTLKALDNNNSAHSQSNLSIVGTQKKGLTEMFPMISITGVSVGNN